MFHLTMTMELIALLGGDDSPFVEVQTKARSNDVAMGDDTRFSIIGF